VSLQFSNQTANDSTFSLGNCADEKFFICEVKLIFIYLLVFMKENLQRAKGATEADVIQEECMTIYDITDGRNFRG